MKQTEVESWIRVVCYHNRLGFDVRPAEERETTPVPSPKLGDSFGTWIAHLPDGNWFFSTPMKSDPISQYNGLQNKQSLIRVPAYMPKSNRIKPPCCLALEEKKTQPKRDDHHTAELNQVSINYQRWFITDTELLDGTVRNLIRSMKVLTDICETAVLSRA